MADAQTLTDATALERLDKRIKRLIVVFIVTFVVLILVIGCLAFLAWRKSKAIDKEIENALFSQFVLDFSQNLDSVTPTVNTIQFLRHGYSITFDSVKYTQEGLELSGTVGNPTQLWISSLALKFTARPYAYKFEDKWLESYRKNQFVWWDTEWDIGTGQTTVGLLNPGTSVPFSVTIPNVKQTKDEPQIIVEFSGERYSYYK